MQTNRSNAGALVGGAIMITFGLLALAGQLFRFIDWGLLWPIIVIAIGGVFFVAMFAGGKQTAAFAIPGSIVSGIGLMLLIQKTTGHWETLSYFWTCIIMFIGAGIYIMGWFGDDTAQKQSGARVLKVGLILFIIFGAFFEMLFSSFNNLLFPILLILLGGYLVIARSGVVGSKSSDEHVNQVIHH
jgi:hypothetical protein